MSSSKGWITQSPNHLLYIEAGKILQLLSLSNPTRSTGNPGTPNWMHPQVGAVTTTPVGVPLDTVVYNVFPCFLVDIADEAPDAPGGFGSMVFTPSVGDPCHLYRLI